MDVLKIIDRVLPEDSILYKHNHSYFSFYLDDRSFEDGRDFLTQKSDEKFSDFIERLVEALMKYEENNDERLVAVDYALNQ